MKFIHKPFIFVYSTVSVKFKITVLARSPTVKDKIIFNRRVTIVKNRY